MKASFHLGAGKALHNDRHFDISKADHIDRERQEKNQYVCISYPDIQPDKGMSFEDWEKKYYSERFGQALEETNAKYIAQRHPEKCRTMDDWMKTYKPTEAIIQIGTQEDHPSGKTLVKSFNDAIQEIMKRYPQIKPLDVALHMDEATPHIQMRFVIEGHDRNGNLKPLKTQGLKEMGIERPDLTKPEGRNNNRLMTFTAEARSILYDAIERQGIELDREPRLESQHLDVIEYKKQETLADLSEAERELSSARTVFEQEKQEHAAQIEALKDSYSEQQELLQAEYEAQRTALDAEYAQKKKIIAEKKAGLDKQEKAIEGRSLKLKELKELEGKRIWSAEDKADILKTASEAAQNTQKAHQAISAKNEAVKAQKAAERAQMAAEKAQRAAEQKVDGVDFVSETLYKHTMEENKRLKEDIKVRDNFIRESGLMPAFIQKVQEMGYELAVKVKEMKRAIEHFL